MDAYELLVATEKALGDAHLYNTHMQLIEERTLIKEQLQHHGRKATELERLLKQHNEQRRDYERYEQREALRKEVRDFAG